jgi:hypothetical protein
MEVLSRNFLPGGTGEESREISVSKDDDRTEIRTEHFLNTSKKRYAWAYLLGVSVPGSGPKSNIISQRILKFYANIRAEMQSNSWWFQALSQPPGSVNLRSADWNVKSQKE